MRPEHAAALGVALLYDETDDPEAKRLMLETIEDLIGGVEMAQMVVIEVMPAHLVASHKAARNFGSYPANGAERYVTTREWAEEVTAGAEYDHIVRDASDKDLERYSELPESW